MALEPIQGCGGLTQSPSNAPYPSEWSKNETRSAEKPSEALVVIRGY